MGARNFAFMSFLDLISCAFGAAILIFLVSVTTEQSQATNAAADVLLIRCIQQQGEPIEVHFVVREPNGRVVRSVSGLPRGYSRFIASTHEQAGSYLIIPEPAPGQWSIQAYWANESIKADESSVAKIEVLSPRLKKIESVSLAAVFSASNRFSEPLVVDIATR